MNEEMIEEELKILFYALCDGLRQEVKQRRLAQMTTSIKENFSLANEREVGMASALSLHLRTIGFVVQLESYFSKGSKQLRPDFCIWLPASQKYIYLELKAIGWGSDYGYYCKKVFNDLDKLKDINEFNEKIDLGNGVIAIGFSRNPEKQQDKLWIESKQLSQEIISHYPYEKIGLERIDLQGMDRQSLYAMIGLWFRKY